MFADASALVIALIASVVAARPANERNTYGYQRAEVFGALINAVLLIVLCVWIAVEAVQRLLHPRDVEVAEHAPTDEKHPGDEGVGDWRG